MHGFKGDGKANINWKKLHRVSPPVHVQKKHLVIAAKATSLLQQMPSVAKGIYSKNKWAWKAE